MRAFLQRKGGLLLEDQSQAELYVAPLVPVVAVAPLLNVNRRDAARDVGIIRQYEVVVVVKGIVQFATELHFELLCDRELLRHREVEVPAAGPTELVSLHVVVTDGASLAIESGTGNRNILCRTDTDGAPYPWLLHPVKKPRRKVAKKATKK